MLVLQMFFIFKMLLGLVVDALPDPDPGATRTNYWPEVGKSAQIFILDLTVPGVL